MAAEWWWFLVLNAIVAAVAVLSKVGPSSSTPHGGGVTRRASSATAMLQRLRSSFFSFPSIALPPQPEAAAVFSQETEEPEDVPASPAKPVAPTPQPLALACTPPPAVFSQQETEEPAEASASASFAKPAASTPQPLALARTPPPAPSAEPVVAEKEHVGEEEDDPNAMSMEEAYALIQAARARPAESSSEREGEARPSDVDAKAEEFIQGFKENLRQQRLNSIFNYTQMLKKRARGEDRRQTPAVQEEDRKQL